MAVVLGRPEGSSEQGAPDVLGLLGTTVAGKYAIESVVAEGGFSVVYRARHLIWQRPVAIKAFKLLGELPSAERERLVQSFIQEGALLAQLSERSAAICQARDIGTLATPQGASIPFMVLEWIEGITLEAVLASERRLGLPQRTLEETVRLLDAPAHALALAHELGIVHRDLKPANLFVIGDARRDDFQIKILDFGIANVVSDAQEANTDFRKAYGEMSAFHPAYAAPEQFSRAYGPIGPWTDVFALALIVVEVLSGSRPLETRFRKDAAPGSSRTGLDLTPYAKASADRTYRPTPRAVGESVSDEVEALFARALAVDPADRPQTVGEFWNALRAAIGSPPLRGLADTGHPGEPDGAEDHVPRSKVPTLLGLRQLRRRRLRSVLTWGIVSTLLVAGGAFFAVARSRGQVLTGPPGAQSAATQAAPPTSTTALVPTPAPAPTCPEGMIMIAAGRFFMGSDDDGLAEFEKNQAPSHPVELDAYCIDRFEVSVALYRACAERGECPHPPQTNDWPDIDEPTRKLYDPLCNAREPNDRADHPINCVDWEMADLFCRAHGKRLPTEAEWEFAARGPDGRIYPWGDDEPSASFLNACGKECAEWGKKVGANLAMMYPEDDGWPTTAPVGSFPRGASRYGVEDVVGNVWEWVADWYGPYPSEPQKNPKGPLEGTERVTRGGAWNGSYPAWVKPTFRFKLTPQTRSYGVGFRCAKTL